MISDVTFSQSAYAPPPAKFEAGTANIAGAIALAAALDYAHSVGMSNIAAHEKRLIDRLTERLSSIDGLTVVGGAEQKAGAVSFVIDGVPPSKIAGALDKFGVAVRAGHHCAQPILRLMGRPETVRPSVGMYNGLDEIEFLCRLLSDFIKNKRLYDI
jgi:cysteine desulfurase/selenocysteine lyase